jgi:endonuclease YncB( thermonuclease family)
MSHRFVAALFLSSICLAGDSAAPPIIESFSAKVVGVTDGDTIKVLREGKTTVTIRLEGIDAPEHAQEYGAKARQALSKLVFGKQVTVRKTGEDRYKRTLAFIDLGDAEANAKLVEDGWAWHFVKYNREQRLANLESAARTAKRGLWAGNNPLAPWDFRDLPNRAANLPPTAPTERFWLNTSSDVRHNAGCKHFGTTKKGRYCGANEGKACGTCGG